MTQLDLKHYTFVKRFLTFKIKIIKIDVIQVEKQNINVPYIKKIMDKTKYLENMGKIRISNLSM